MLFLRILVPVLLLASAAEAGTILNTLQAGDDGGPGWSGALDGLYSGSGGNTERIIFTAGGRVQWRGDVDRLRLQVSGGYEESAQLVTARNVVAHLRHNHDLDADWATILFVQVQANPFQRLKSRWLAGAGLRRDLVDDEAGLVTVGVTPMLEVERLDGETGHTARGRLSTFLHLTRHLGDSAKLDIVGFWQPLFSDFANVRSVGTLALVVKVAGSVDLKVGLNIEDNSRPPAGVKPTDWGTFAGFGVEF